MLLGSHRNCIGASGYKAPRRLINAFAEFRQSSISDWSMNSSCMFSRNKRAQLNCVPNDSSRPGFSLSRRRTITSTSSCSSLGQPRFRATAWIARLVASHISWEATTSSSGDCFPHTGKLSVSAMIRRISLSVLTPFPVRPEGIAPLNPIVPPGGNAASAACDTVAAASMPLRRAT